MHNYYFYKKKDEKYKMIGSENTYRADRVETAWMMFVKNNSWLFSYEPMWKEAKEEWSYIKS